MRALLLSAGLGTRLKPLTDTVPKCLVPLNGRPLMDYWLHGLFAAGVERILVNLHYLPDAVQSFLRASPFASRIDTVLEADLLGTAGTLKYNRTFLDGAPFFVAHADNLCIADLSRFIAAHHARPLGTLATMMTFKTDEPEQCGIVETDRDGSVLKFHEKQANPPGNNANAAVYVMEPAVFDILGKMDKPLLDISLDLVPALLPHVGTWHNDECHIDVGTPARYAAAETAAMKYAARMEDLGWNLQGSVQKIGNPRPV